MSHHDIFRLGLYHLDTMGWHKTIPPKKMEMRKNGDYV